MNLRKQNRTVGAESGHRRYEVWEIPAELVKPTEAEAELDQFAKVAA